MARSDEKLAIYNLIMFQTEPLVQSILCIIILCITSCQVLAKKQVFHHFQIITQGSHGPSGSTAVYPDRLEHCG